MPQGPPPRRTVPPPGSPKAGDGRDRRGKRQPEPNPLVLVGVAAELGLAVAVMTLLGWWLDGKWGTAPWLALAGAAIGIVGGFYNLWRVSRRFFE